MSTAIDWDTIPDLNEGPQRDHFGVYRNGNNQPLIVPAGGGKRIAYQRVTNFIEQLSDGAEGLRLWQERLTLAGLVQSAQLRSELMASGGDMRGLSGIATRAARLAGRDEKQEWGSMMHQVTEAMDRGDMMPRQWFNDNTKALEPVPAEAKRDADAYRLATRCLEHEAIEQMHVYDPYRVAGTPDRRSRLKERGKYQGKPKIADLKSGRLHARMVEAQLAMYSRSQPYDPGTERRLDPVPADVNVGIVIHLPMKQGTCQLYRANLAKGWADCKIAHDKRQKGLRRKLSAMGRLVELGPDVALIDRIWLCANLDALRDVWQEAAACGELTDDFKVACLDRKQQLAPTSK